jgi:DNA-binding CsgD family transcriptional regulator
MPDLLATLAGAFPYPAYVLDSNGRVRWMSSPGAARLGADLGNARVVPARGLGAGLDALARCVTLSPQDPLRSPEVTLRAAGLLHLGERVAVRLFDEENQVMALISLVPALSQPCTSSALASVGRIPGLGEAETRVARMAAEGFTVLNMAAHIGSSEATIRTHLSRAYRKLCVHSRAELAMVLYRGGTAGGQ